MALYSASSSWLLLDSASDRELGGFPASVNAAEKPHFDAAPSVTGEPTKWIAHAGEGWRDRAVHVGPKKVAESHLCVESASLRSA